MRWALAVVLGLMEGVMLVVTVPMVWAMRGENRWLGIFSVVVTVLLAVAGLRYSPGKKGRIVFGAAVSAVLALVAVLWFALSQTRWD